MQNWGVWGSGRSPSPVSSTNRCSKQTGSVTKVRAAATAAAAVAAAAAAAATAAAAAAAKVQPMNNI